MKSNRIITIIFILVVALIIALAAYFINDRAQKSDEDPNSLIDNLAVVENMKLGITNYDTMNPFLTRNRDIINYDKLIFEPLVNITPDYHVTLCLAKDVNRIDDTKYEVKIDKDIKWQNGSNLKPEDVKFTIERLKERNCVYSNNVAAVESVDITGDDTCIIHLKYRVDFFEYNLSFPIMSSSYYEGEDFNTSSKIPIGTGMYKIASIDNDNIFLIINDKWHKLKTNKPRTSTITIHRYSAIGEMYNAFKLGNIDIISTKMGNYADYVGTMGYSRKEYIGRNFDFLSLNCNDSILSDVHVRRAIAFAINKESLVSSVYGNNRVVSDNPMDYGSYLNSDENKTYFSQDQARSELTQGGWVDSGSGWVKDGVLLTITMTVPNNDQGRIDSANNIRTQLSYIGINVRLSLVSYDNYLSIVNNKNYQMLFTGVQDSINPNLNYFYGEGNLANYNNSELISNIGYLDKYQDIIKQSNIDVPYIGLYRDKGTLILNANVGGEFQCTSFNIYNNFDKWYRQQ